MMTPSFALKPPKKAPNAKMVIVKAKLAELGIFNKIIRVSHAPINKAVLVYWL